MTACTICRFDSELDDIAVSGNRPICLTCYGRLTETTIRMPKNLRRQIIAVLSGVTA